jgi:hypothetical protein
MPSYRLQFQDWAYLKAEWEKFTDAFVNSPLHMIMAGRAAFEYDYFEDDDGKKQLEKTDVRMAVEKDMGYEPSLLIYMERHREMETMKAYRTATVLKDRGDVIDGEVYRNPTFDNFLPHIKLLNLGGQHVGFDQTRTSATMIPADVRDMMSTQRAIVLGEIEELLVTHYPSQAAEHKRLKITKVREHFQAAWPEVEKVMPLGDLRAGYCSLYLDLEGKPCTKYGAKPVVDEKPEIDDGLPEFLRRDAAKANEPDPFYIPETAFAGE